MNYRIVYRPTPDLVGRLEEIICHEGGLEATVKNIFANGGRIWELSAYEGDF